MRSSHSLGAARHSAPTSWTPRCKAPQMLKHLCLQGHSTWPCHYQPFGLCSSGAAALCGQHQPTADRCCAPPRTHSSTRKRITAAAKAGVSGEGPQGSIQGSGNSAASTSTTDSLANSQANGSTGATPSATSLGNQAATAQPPGSLQDTERDEELSNLDEEIKRQWAILKQLLHDTPPASAAPVAASNPTAAAVLQQGQQDQQQVEQGQNLVLPWFAKPWITWAMFVWAWVVLVLQWQPLWQPLRETVVDFWSGMTVAASATLLVPHTPMASRFQMDLMSWMTGGWPKAAINAACMFSGILPTLVFTRGLLNAGSVVEQAYGSLVMALHVAFAAWGAAAGQLLQGTSAHTITGPAVVCGLYAGMACVLAREHMELRQAQARAREAPAAEASSSTGPSDLTGGGGSGGGTELTPEEEELLQVPIVSHEAIITFVVALALGWFQPMLGIGGVIGGTLGGLVAGLTCFALIGAFRWCMVRLVSTSFLVLGFALRVPFLVVQFVLGLLVTLVAAAQDMLKGFRRM